MAVIDLHHVSKTYRGKVAALRSVSLTVNRGEVFGLLGPNGAGKSTLIKIMMTVVRPTEAKGTILDHPVGHKPTLARVGYLSENHRYPRYLTGQQTLEFFAALGGVDRKKRRQRTSELVETVGMSGWADKKVGAYSKGMMQRIGLAQALVNDPDLVLLDEPTDGVDPMGRRDIRAILANLRAQGKTVFINSHLLSELEMICDRVAILVGGQVARQGSVDDLTAGKQYFEVETAAGENQLPELLSGKLQSPFTINGKIIRISTTETSVIQPVIDTLRAAGLAIQRVQTIRPSLEQLFMDAVSNGDNSRPTAVGAKLVH